MHDLAMRRTSSRRAASALISLAVSMAGLLMVPAPATHAEPATAAAAQAQPQAVAAPRSVKRVRTSYGAEPVRRDRGRQTVLITFHGKRGDVVRLDTGVSSRLAGSKTQLLRGEKAVPSDWRFFWKLPRSGRFTFRFVPSRKDVGTRWLQLVKVRALRIGYDETVSLPASKRGFVNAVRFSIADGERALLRTQGYAWKTVLNPNGDTDRVAGSLMQFEPGQPVGSTYGLGAGKRPLGAGNVLVLVGGKSVSLSRSVLTPLALDGAPVELRGDGELREYAFAVNLPAGTAFHANAHGTSKGRQSLTDPHGYGSSVAPDTDIFWTDEEGEHRFSVILKKGATTRLTLDSVLDVGQVGVGSPVTFTTAEPGQYVVAEVTRDRAMASITASHATVTRADGTPSTWRVVAGPKAQPVCGFGPGTPLGCGDYSTGVIDQDTSTDDSWAGWSTEMVALMVPSGSSGSVTFTLDPSTYN